MASVPAAVTLNGRGTGWRHLHRTRATPGAVVALAVLLGVLLGSAIGAVVSSAERASPVSAMSVPRGAVQSTERAPRTVEAVGAVGAVGTVEDAAMATAGVVDAGGASAATVSDTTTSHETTSGADETAADATAADATTSSSFTLGDLAAGEVSAERFMAFWDAELERIGTAACPAAVGAGSTVITMTVGATPPAELSGTHPDYAPLLAAAHEAAAARCVD